MYVTFKKRAKPLTCSQAEHPVDIGVMYYDPRNPKMSESLYTNTVDEDNSKFRQFIQQLGATTDVFKSPKQSRAEKFEAGKFIWHLSTVLNEDDKRAWMGNAFAMVVFLEKEVIMDPKFLQGIGKVTQIFFLVRTCISCKLLSDPI